MLTRRAPSAANPSANHVAACNQLQDHLMKRIEEMSVWERLYFPEIIRGLILTGSRFWRNLAIHTLQKFGLARDAQAAVTVQYPEERRAIRETFRGRHLVDLETGRVGSMHRMSFCARQPVPPNASISRPGNTRTNPSRSFQFATRSTRCAAFIAVSASRLVRAMRFAWIPERILEILVSLAKNSSKPKKF